jgi:hypothetical protein
MASNAYAAREKINFATMPSPALLTLESEGEEAPGKFGLQYRYFLGAGQITWVDPPIHDLIQQAGAHAGDTIRVSRHESRNGNRRGPLLWSIHMATKREDEPPEADEFDRHLQSQPQPAAQARPTQPQAAPPTRATASRQPAAPTPPAAAPAATEAHPVSASAQLALALTEAIDAARSAESYAEAHGTRISFGPEDIRAMALSIYIGATRTGGR